jgi:L-alanine-DL-glutamate epimerase-like enolase superfamily enzyme
VPHIEVSSEGLINLPARPGMGYRLDPAKVAQYRIRLEEFQG